MYNGLDCGLLVQDYKKYELTEADEIHSQYIVSPWNH